MILPMHYLVDNNVNVTVTVTIVSGFY